MILLAGTVPGTSTTMSEIRNTYQTKEAAFEAAVAAASLAMRQGHSVRLTVPESENTVGAENSGG
ncbi:phosphotransferase system HPr-like phosphotransfer protein [Bradyrhizobium sp. GM0.4]